MMMFGKNSLFASEAQSQQSGEHDQEKLLEALGVIRQHARELYDDEKAGVALERLLDTAKVHINEHGARSSSQESPEIPPDLQELVKLIAAFESEVEAVENSGKVLCDWIAKGGRSLGFD